MKNKPYQIHAFTDKMFSGNVSAVYSLKEWLTNNFLQAIVIENNLAEIAFYVKQCDYFEIRWFTPRIEVDLLFLKAPDGDSIVRA